MKKFLVKIFIIVITILAILSQTQFTFGANNKVPSKTKITRLRVDDGKAIIEWKKVKNIDGYSIYMSRSKNGTYKKIKNIYGNKNTKYTKKGLDETKKYYFKIKTFKVKNTKKIYSKSSNIKSAGGLIASKVLISTTNSENRNTNLKIASKKIDGIVLKPNQTFRWSKVVGRLTQNEGYRQAIAYRNGNNTLLIGGGVCQVSTNIYQCVKKANMKVIERHEHGKDITYIENGEDATVAYGTKDFAFKNNKSYAIKIKADAYNNATICQFYNIGDK